MIFSISASIFGKSSGQTYVPYQCRNRNRGNPRPDAELHLVTEQVLNGLRHHVRRAVPQGIQAFLGIRPEKLTVASC
jgi:hypothetical protein